MLRHGLACLLALLLAAPSLAHGTCDDDSTHGYLVYAVGTIKIGMHFSFLYRPMPADDARAVSEGVIKPTLGGAFHLRVKNPDFSGDETGHVVVRRMPAGRYEVHDFAFGGLTPGVGSTAWSPARTFSLPFEIRSGEATYIGSFMRAPSLGTPLEARLGAAGFFVIADRASRDLPIAAPRLPTGIRVANEVTDVDSLGSAALRSRHP